MAHDPPDSNSNNIAEGNQSKATLEGTIGSDGSSAVNSKDETDETASAAKIGQKIDNRHSHGSTTIGEQTNNYLLKDAYQFSQEALTPCINSENLSIDHGEGDVAREVEANLGGLCEKLEQQRLLILTCPDMRAGFDVACAVASDSRFKDLEKRTFLPTPAGVEMRRTSEANDVPPSTGTAETKATGKEGLGRADKLTLRAGQGVYTLRDLAVADQEELRDCVLLVEIVEEADYGILLPASPTELNQILSGLKEHHRFLITYVIGTEEEKIGRQLSSINVAVQKINCIPYLIARTCPSVRNKMQAAGLARDGLSNAIKPATPERDRWGLLMALLNACSEADDENFAEAFNAQLKRRQEQKQDIGKSMEELESNPRKRLLQTLKFVAAYFRGLEISVFRKLVSDILNGFDKEETSDADRLLDPIMDKDGKPVPQKPLPSYVEQWRRNASSLLSEAELLVCADGQKRIMSFKDPLMEQSVRDYFEDMFFEKSAYSQKLREIGALFAVNRDVLPQMIDFYADMAVAEPMGFQDECLPALIEHCVQATDDYVYERAVETMAYLVQALIERPSCVQFVHRLRYDLIEYHSDYYIAYEIAKRLSLNPKFDSLTWFRSVISSDGYGSNLSHAIAQHLQSRLRRHPQGPYATLSELIKWLPEKLGDNLSKTQDFAWDFIIRQALYPWFYAIAPFEEHSSYLDYESFLSVCADEKIGKEFVSRIIKTLLPLKVDEEDLSAAISLSAILIGCFFVLDQRGAFDVLKTDLSTARARLMDGLSDIERPQQNRVIESLYQWCEWFRADMDPIKLNREQYQRLRDLIAIATQLIKDLRTRFSG